MPVEQLGPQDVVSIDPDSTIGEAVEKLRSEEVGAVVVVENDEPVGMITDRDIAMAVGQEDDLENASIESVMTEDPVTIHENEEAMAISQMIDEHHVRRIPVVNDDGKLTGIVTLDDLVATIGEQLENVSDTIEAQSPEYSP